MRIAPNRLLTLILALTLPSGFVFGAIEPPQPQGAPVPVGLPVDSGLFLLLIIAIVLGVYKVYKFNQIKKASN